MSTGKSSVASRFVSASELESNPNASTSASGEYDPRSLYERLQTNKEAKDAVLDEKYKLSNQFRGIDDGEAEFLQGVERERRREEEERRMGERGELERFRVAKATSGRVGEGGVAVGKDKLEEKTTLARGEEAAKTNKKKRKANSSALLGVVKKKPSKPSSASTATTSSSPTANPSSAHSGKPSS
ncbi:FAM192A_Fyv6_N domain-containing protein [Pseudozyma hubeiensis]|nr:FAM192A_Fyv6_N domain-containing protein [Pseudozyma hubeiensis]